MRVLADRLRKIRLKGYARKIMMLQTADGGEYADMLAVGRSVNETYATAHGLKYHYYIGIKRGYFPWHAAFNKVFLIRELMLAGFRGWIFYLDADAFVHDCDFDLAGYLSRYFDKALIAGPGGTGGEPWDINDGVFLINLAHDDARQLIKVWHDHIMSTSDEQLRNAPVWYDVMSDQQWLHLILQQEPRFLEGLHLAERSFFNDYKASFVRQVFRAPGLSIADRIAMMKNDISS
jgi:hypothetical protein